MGDVGLLSKLSNVLSKVPSETNNMEEQISDRVFISHICYSYLRRDEPLYHRYCADTVKIQNFLSELKTL